MFYDFYRYWINHELMLSDFQVALTRLEIKSSACTANKFRVAFDKVIIMIENIYDGNQKHKYCFRQQYYEQQEMLNVSRRTTQRLSFFEDTKTHKSDINFSLKRQKLNIWENNNFPNRKWKLSLLVFDCVKNDRRRISTPSQIYVPMMEYYSTGILNAFFNFFAFKSFFFDFSIFASKQIFTKHNKNCTVCFLNHLQLPILLILFP